VAGLRRLAYLYTDFSSGRACGSGCCARPTEQVGAHCADLPRQHAHRAVAPEPTTPATPSARAPPLLLLVAVGALAVGGWLGTGIDVSRLAVPSGWDAGSGRAAASGAGRPGR
jgi:hypothetical protein